MVSKFSCTFRGQIFFLFRLPLKFLLYHVIWVFFLYLVPKLNRICSFEYRSGATNEWVSQNLSRFPYIYIEKQQRKHKSPYKHCQTKVPAQESIQTLRNRSTRVYTNTEKQEHKYKSPNKHWETQAQAQKSIQTLRNESASTRVHTKTDKHKHKSSYKHWKTQAQAQESIEPLRNKHKSPYDIETQKRKCKSPYKHWETQGQAKGTVQTLRNASKSTRNHTNTEKHKRKSPYKHSVRNTSTRVHTNTEKHKRKRKSPHKHWATQAKESIQTLRNTIQKRKSPHKDHPLLQTLRNTSARVNTNTEKHKRKHKHWETKAILMFLLAFLSIVLGLLCSRLTITMLCSLVKTKPKRWLSQEAPGQTL